MDWALSVFKDNSGVVAFDDDHAVCIKVETHNRPSALEPYGGAATGAGGCIRDVMGTGLGAHPIANTDVFCVADPLAWRARADAPDAPATKPLPPGTLHPRAILANVVAGVRDYGNRMGIPTVNGAVYFDDRYVGNPLVFCGCVGVIPRRLIVGRARAGDRIVALGGRTGRDGIHGATFSSAELQATHADEFAHAVQIGNAIEEKRLLDALLRARDHEGGPLYHAITDCGAGGFSSAIGEMGADLGALVDLDKAPLKYAGLSYTEIWISEAQERMVLAVPPENLTSLRDLCAQEGVEASDLGVFGTPDQELILRYEGVEVGRLSTRFLHDGLPRPTREAVWNPPTPAAPAPRDSWPDASHALLALLAHPNIASKRGIIRQYDHMVQGNTIVKPLVGPGEAGPSDAAVIAPVAGRPGAVAIACGLNPLAGDPTLGGDPYQMALHAIDECVRNLVCVGADPARIAILDNFCWPSCDDPTHMGALVRACAGCYDGAKAYRTPFVSGKDSLNNQLRYADPATGKPRLIEIPYTLLITGLGLVRDASRCVTMDAKRPGNVLVLVGRTTRDLGASHAQKLWGTHRAASPGVPTLDLDLAPKTATFVAHAIREGLVRSAHDCSEGGVLVALAEMLIATVGRDGGPLGARVEGDPFARDLPGLDPLVGALAESPGRYILELRPGDVPILSRLAATHDQRIAVSPLGPLTSDARLSWSGLGLDARVPDLALAWQGTLDW